MSAIAFLFCFLGASAFANEFKPAANVEKIVSCDFAKNLVKFEGLTPQFSLYDSNTKVIKINRCTTAQVADLTFYTVEFESEVLQGKEVLKVLSYEIALLDSKLNSLKPVRSEIIDQYSEEGDAVNRKFTTKGLLTWGKSSQDSQVMLKFDISEPKEKPFSYLLKLNKKKSWFENIF